MFYYSLPLPCTWTADEALGIAALVFSLLAFIFSLATPLWLCLQKRGFSLNTVLKGRGNMLMCDGFKANLQLIILMFFSSLTEFPRAQSSPELVQLKTRCICFFRIRWVFNSLIFFLWTPRGDSPKRDCEGDVYMNYEDSNPAYSDLDPGNMSVDDVYSSLSWASSLATLHVQLHVRTQNCILRARS